MAQRAYYYGGQPAELSAREGLSLYLSPSRSRLRVIVPNAQ